MLAIEIDRWTNSLLHCESGTSFQTQIIKIAALSVNVSKHWTFDWRKELKQHEVFGIIVPDWDASSLQGLVCLESAAGWVKVLLAESAPHNRGPHKQFEGVGAHLFAFACKRSQEKGFGGVVAFEAKTNLIEHDTSSLGAHQLGSSQRMIIYEEAAAQLTTKYFHHDKR